MPPAGEIVTVLVPARNEERSIARCLESILSQDHSALEVIVLDAASCDSRPRSSGRSSGAISESHWSSTSSTGSRSRSTSAWLVLAADGSCE